jgi:hypothetical protein
MEAYPERVTQCCSDTHFSKGSDGKLESRLVCLNTASLSNLTRRGGSSSGFLCITLVSLPVEIDLNLGDHTQTRNAKNPNKNGHKKTGLTLSEKLLQDCKTFIHRFDSDRCLQNLNTFNSLQVPPLVAHFRVCHCRFTPR